MHSFTTRPMTSKAKPLAVLTLERKYRLLEAKEHRLLKAGLIEEASAIKTVKNIVLRQLHNTK